MTIGIIPARFRSSRLPGKPMAQLGDFNMIQLVYLQCKKATCLDRIIVATDDQRIVESIHEIEGEVTMTDVHHLSGTDRCIEVAKKHLADHYINIQGDEPFIEPEDIDLVANGLFQGAAVTTLKKQIEDVHEIDNPNCVKVVCDLDGKALYFSRSRIPYNQGTTPKYFKHKGIYGFSRHALNKIASLSPSSLERSESLEQLRWLECGMEIKVLDSPHETISIDTEQDLEAARKRINGKI